MKESFCVDCLKPLQAKINSSNVPADFNSYDPATDPDLRENAVRLSRQLLEEGCPRYEPDPGAKARLEVDSATVFDRRYTELISRIRDIVQASLPASATVMVVSKGDERLLDLGGRQAWHFPQNEAGSYAGYYPADSAAAIAHLEALRAKGADFLLFPHAALWWLEHYGDFHRHLEAHYRRICDDGSCVIYRLCQP